MTDRDQAVLKLYQQGLMLKDIAPQVGLSANYVGVILKRLGVERPSKPQKSSFRASNGEVVAGWEKGLSVSAIAERLGMSAANVSRILRDAGIKKTHRHRYDGEGGCIARGKNAFARIARRT